MVLSHKPPQKSHFVLQISQLSKIVQNLFCIYPLRMDLSFQEKKRFVNMLNGLQVTTIFVILENSGVFIETPCNFWLNLRLNSHCYPLLYTVFAYSKHCQNLSRISRVNPPNPSGFYPCPCQNLCLVQSNYFYAK